MNKKIKIILVILVIIILFSIFIIAKTSIFKNNAVFNNYNAYNSEISTSYIGVSLLENGSEIAYRGYNLDGTKLEKSDKLMLKLEDENLVPGKTYPEEIAVYNSGAIDEYVRVIIYRSFKGGSGNNVSPELINLNYCKDSRWIVDERASTPERTILYYIKQLPSGGKTNLIDSFKIASSVLDAVNFTSQTTSDGKTIITSSKECEGLNACIEIEVDAVQTHNAKDAIKAAWGVEVDVAADGTISLK